MYDQTSDRNHLMKYVQGQGYSITDSLYHTPIVAFINIYTCVKILNRSTSTFAENIYLVLLQCTHNASNNI